MQCAQAVGGVRGRFKGRLSPLQPPGAAHAISSHTLCHQQSHFVASSVSLSAISNDTICHQQLHDKEVWGGHQRRLGSCSNKTGLQVQDLIHGQQPGALCVHMVYVCVWS